MSLVKTNAGDVARRLMRLQKALPGAVAAALEPEQWRFILSEAAEKTLLAMIWAHRFGADDYPAVVRLVRRMVNEMVTEVFATGSRHTLSMPRTPAELLTGLGRAAGAEKNTRQYPDSLRARRQPLALSPENESSLQELKDAILDWVREEKRLDPDDINQTPEQIAGRIYRIAGLTPAKDSFGSPFVPSEKMGEAADRIMVEVRDFIETRGKSGSVVSPELISQWLGAVAASWRSVIRTRLPQKIRQQLDRVEIRMGGGQFTLTA